MSTRTPAVEILGPWTKGSFSNTLQNVGCAYTAPNSLGGVSIRKDDGGPVLHFDGVETAVLFAGIRDGEFGEFPLP